MGKAQKILFVDDESNVLRALKRVLMDEEYVVFSASSGEEALDLLAREPGIQLVVSDYRMPQMNGVDFLRRVWESWPDTVRIVLSGYGDTAAVVSAINEGRIYRFIPKPWNDDDLKVQIANAFEHYSLQMQNRKLAEILKRKNKELQELNARLEKRVEERSAEVLFQNQVLIRSQQILDSLPVGVLGVDRQGLVVQCNRLACLAMSDHCPCLAGNDFRQALPPELAGCVERIGREETVQCRVELGPRTYLVRGAMVSHESEPVGKVLVLDPLAE